MKTAMLLATAAVPAPSAGQPSGHAQMLGVQEADGRHLDRREDDVVVITNSARRTRLSFPADDGTRFPPDAKAAVAAKDDVLSRCFEKDIQGIDFVGELNKQCR